MLVLVKTTFCFDSGFLVLWWNIPELLSVDCRWCLFLCLNFLPPGWFHNCSQLSEIGSSKIAGTCGAGLVSCLLSTRQIQSAVVPEQLPSSNVMLLPFICHIPRSVTSSLVVDAVLLEWTDGRTASGLPWSRSLRTVRVAAWGRERAELLRGSVFHGRRERTVGLRKTF